MKIYIVEHTCNKPCSLEHFHDIVDAFESKEDAQEKLFEICEAVAKREYPLFNNMEVKRIPSDFGEGLVYEWKDDQGDTNYTHFKIIETKLH